MKNLVRIMLEGAYINLKRLLFASDRVTDKKLRNKIIAGEIQPTTKVATEACIGCGGCSNVCPTGSVEMIKLDTPIEIHENWIKEETPTLHPETCVHCYYCHDFCPIYALFGETGTIHPNDVGEITTDTHQLLETPFKISDDKIAFISQYLSDKTIIKKTEDKK